MLSAEKCAIICEVKRADKIGLISNPWGVPIFGRGKDWEVVLLMQKELVQEDRNDRTVWMMLGEKPCKCRRWSSWSWLILSKKPLMSRVTMLMTTLVLHCRWDCMKWCAQMLVSEVEENCRQPNWWGCKIGWLRMSSWMKCTITFSNSLPKHSNSAIGQYACGNE